ncbi:MAG: thiamine monophosphate synthase [Oceanicaulis sp.]|nr:thiamine monophosphate synthase [Oceanicaulis sp.]
MMPPYDAPAGLARQALAVQGARGAGPPALLALTDPARTPDPEAFAAAVPGGSAVIYRHFGVPDRLEVAKRLAAICRERDNWLLVSGDPDLARRAGADGVHWPERQIAEAAACRARGDAGIYTAAAHSWRALARASAAGVDAALLSAVFPSQSPSAGRPLGCWSASAMARATDLPVYALGGVNERTAKRLTGLGFSGIACVGAIRSAGPTRT